MSPFLRMSLSSWEYSISLVIDILLMLSSKSSYFDYAFPSSNILSYISFKNCCWGPRTDPGLQIRAHPIKAAAGNPKCFMQYRQITDAVLPNPALQWTAIPPLSSSTAVMNFSITSYIKKVSKDTNLPLEGEFHL